MHWDGAKDEDAVLLIMGEQRPGDIDSGGGETELGVMGSVRVPNSLPLPFGDECGSVTAGQDTGSIDLLEFNVDVKFSRIIH